MRKLLLALLAMAAVQMSGAIKIVAMSDIHAMSEMLVEKRGAAIDKYAASDMRMIKESAEILRTVIGKIIEQRPDIVMISGDLTKDGERLSHEFVASQLERL
ncbi:MAG: metallophosphoesterase, partial [Bacteroidales bacterium]|nr:metallophosphoesterase [Bacteroidales bacterium]